MTIRRKVSALLCLAVVFSMALTGCNKEAPNKQTASNVSQTTEPAQPVEPTEQVTAPLPPGMVQEANKPATTITLDPNSDVAVTVNGTDITEAQVNALVDPQMAAVQKVDPNRPPQMIEQIRTMLHRRMLDMLIVQTIMEPLAKKAGVTVSDDEIQAELKNAAEMNGMTVDQLKARSQALGQSFDSIVDQIKMLIRYTKTAEAGDPNATKVTDEEVKQYYDDNKAQFETPEKVRASHILVKVDPGDSDEVKAQKRAKAEGLLKQLKAGKDFAELAKETGGYPSAPRGGDLGEFARGQMVKPFEDAAFSLKVGELSDIVETQFGYHIIKVTGHTDASSKSFDEVKDEIRKHLEQSKKDKILQNFINKVRSEAKIVYPEGKGPQPTPAMPMQ